MTDKKHFYKNHQHVISVLTANYGFKYQGLGDGSEECFYKDSQTPEKIYVHPSGCSYIMYSSRAIMASRLNPANFPSKYESERSQEKAFTELLAHLDKYTVLVEEAVAVVPTPKEEGGIQKNEVPSFQEIMAFNKDVWPLFRIYHDEGRFSAKDALDFLNGVAPEAKKASSRDVVEGGHVIFVEIPRKLWEIVHEGHPYFVYEIKDGKAHLYLDNDFGHWIDIDCLCGVSKESVQRRRKY